MHIVSYKKCFHTRAKNLYVTAFPPHTHKRVESFLHKDVNFVVTGSQEALKEKRTDVRGGGGGEKTLKDEARNHTKQPDSVLSSEKRQRQPGTPRPLVLNFR